MCNSIYIVIDLFYGIQNLFLKNVAALQPDYPAYFLQKLIKIGVVKFWYFHFSLKQYYLKKIYQNQCH